MSLKPVQKMIQEYMNFQNDRTTTHMCCPLGGDRRSHGMIDRIAYGLIM